MERFFQRVDEVIEYYSKNDGEEYKKTWVDMKSMSLEGKTRAWMVARLESYQKTLTAEEMVMSMKEVAKIETKSQNAYHDPLFNQFVYSIEDDSMPPVYKRTMFRKLDTLLWDPKFSACGIDSAGNYEPSCGCHSSIAGAICKF